ncbi:flavoprotein [Actinomadura madurae]|uniref:flavoprotein n=1 Tax=Actinomadura madurae TaxID=1993 RepID=UPI0020265659|nr:flavoprotein [Actinomadura madurae]URM94976.1 flavoprotein [Actinomadura madurae]
MPVLYVIACGGRPAADLPAFVEGLRSDGWTVCVVSTPSGLKFLDAARLAGITGHPVRSDYKRPEAPDVLPPADAMAVAPATFNTVNKWAHGTSDTLALGLLNEAVGLGLPIVAAPWPNAALARHPVFGRSIAELRAWGSPSCWTRPGCRRRTRRAEPRARSPGRGSATSCPRPWPASDPPPREVSRARPRGQDREYDDQRVARAGPGPVGARPGEAPVAAELTLHLHDASR